MIYVCEIRAMDDVGNFINIEDKPIVVVAYPSIQEQPIELIPINDTATGD